MHATWHDSVLDRLVYAVLVLFTVRACHRFLMRRTFFILRYSLRKHVSGDL